MAKHMENKKCFRMLKKAQKDRLNTEYSLWHFEDLSVIIRKFKIFCITSIIDAVKKNILPVNGSVILFGIDNFDEVCYRNAAGPVLHLLSTEFRYKEYVAVENCDKMKDVLSLLELRRGWKCILRCPDTKKEVPQEMTVAEYLQLHSSAVIEFHIDTEIKWLDIGSLSMNYCDHTPFTQGRHYADSLFVWCRGDQRMRQVTKNVICMFQINLVYGINRNNGDVNTSKYFLTRLATNKINLLLFLTGNERVGGSTKIGDIILNKQTNIRIRQRFRFDNVNFLVESDETNLREVPVFSFVDNMREIIQTNSSPQNTFVLKPILPTDPLIMVLWFRKCAVEILRTALESLLNVDDVILLDKERILSSNEVVPQQPDSVTNYATVNSYPELLEFKEIGCGSYGTVFRCKEDTKTEEFALKEIKMNSNSEFLLDNELDKRLIREVLIAANVPAHDRIIAYHAFYKLKERRGWYFGIRMPLLEGSLYKLLNRKGLEEAHIRHFSIQILNGLNHLQEYNVLHRDLRSKNVLVDRNVGDVKEINVKLCDFGMSKHLNDLASTEAAQGQKPSFVVSYNWMAPEVVQVEMESNYDFKSDVWSFGATVIEMITGKEPHYGMSVGKMSANIEKGVIEYDKSKTSDKLKSFVDCCIRYDAKDRLSCAELLRDPFLMQ